MNNDLLVPAILGTLFLGFVGIGIHQAINKLLSLVDGHLERFQGKLDILLAAQVEHNQKIDILMRRLL